MRNAKFRRTTRWSVVSNDNLGAFPSTVEGIWQSTSVDCRSSAFADWFIKLVQSVPSNEREDVVFQANQFVWPTRIFPRLPQVSRFPALGAGCFKLLLAVAGRLGAASSVLNVRLSLENRSNLFSEHIPKCYKLLSPISRIYHSKTTVYWNCALGPSMKIVQRLLKFFWGNLWPIYWFWKLVIWLFCLDLANL